MARINLLSWRDELRAEKKREFLVAWGGVAILACAVAFFWVESISSTIENQEERNRMLQGGISKLNQQVAEIEKLKSRKQELIQRMKVIQDLQGNRPIIVRLFDELARAIPDGVFLLEVDRKPNLISIKGVADSNNRVSAFMRELDSSDWFSSPNLTNVTRDIELGETANVFKLTVQVSTPISANEEGE